MKLYQCTVCKRVFLWDENSSSYSSIAIDEVMPEQGIRCCCDGCVEVAQEKIKSGDWKLPNVKTKGGFYRITSEAVGYDHQPSQEELKQLFNAATIKA